MPRELEGLWHCTEGTSNKFYEIRYRRNSDDYVCTWGPIGSAGKEEIRDYDYVLKKHRAFRSKGYLPIRGSQTIESISRTPTIPKVEEPVYKKSRLESIEDDEPVKPKVEKKKEPKSRLTSVE